VDAARPRAEPRPQGDGVGPRLDDRARELHVRDQRRDPDPLTPTGSASGGHGVRSAEPALRELQVPGSIANGDLPDDLAGRFQRAIDDNLDLYGQLLQAEVPAEDARFIFPNAMQTNLIMTVNLRQLIHMSGLRLCTMAQWEIRQLFKQIRHEVFRQSHRANLPRRSTWHASHLCADHTYRRGSITGDPTDGTATSSTSTSTPGSYAGSVPRRWGLNSGGRNHEEWSVP